MLFFIVWILAHPSPDFIPGGLQLHSILHFLVHTQPVHVMKSESQDEDNRAISFIVRKIHSEGGINLAISDVTNFWNLPI